MPVVRGRAGQVGECGRAAVAVLDGPDVWFRPRRARCRGCGLTHVLLPVCCLARRADAGEVIGLALEAKAGGDGHRMIAGRLGRPASTVRGWLRAFTARAEQVRSVFTALAASLVTDPPLPARPDHRPPMRWRRSLRLPRWRPWCQGRRGGAVAAGRGGDLRAAAGPGMAGPGGQHELALGGGRGEPESSVIAGFTVFTEEVAHVWG